MYSIVNTLLINNTNFKKMTMLPNRKIIYFPFWKNLIACVAVHVKSIRKYGYPATCEWVLSLFCFISTDCLQAQLIYSSIYRSLNRWLTGRGLTIDQMVSYLEYSIYIKRLKSGSYTKKPESADGFDHSFSDRAVYHHTITGPQMVFCRAKT